MTRSDVLWLVVEVIVALAVARTLWKRFQLWLAEWLLDFIARKKLCGKCFLKGKKTVPADFVTEMPDCPPMTECRSCIEESIPRREVREWAYNKGYIRKA